VRIITWNVNGIRSAAKKGFLARLATLEPDVVCYQEIRATPDQLTEDIREPKGWHIAWHPAQRPGYAGTAAWSRDSHKVEGRGIGDPDEEGRVLVTRIGPGGGVRVVNTYLPSGSSSEARQKIKDAWMPVFSGWAAQFARSKVPTIICGDLNIAHTPRDIFYAKANEGSSGFLPHERAWFGELLGAGWHDVIREESGDRDGPYTWWSNRGQARALDRGWRIDYVLANKAARKLVTAAAVHREESLGISDHAPVSVDLDV